MTGEKKSVLFFHLYFALRKYVQTFVVISPFVSEDNVNFLFYKKKTQLHVRLDSILDVRTCADNMVGENHVNAR